MRKVYQTSRPARLICPNHHHKTKSQKKNQRLRHVDERSPILYTYSYSNAASRLAPRKLAALHHGGVLFLETLSEPGRALEVFVDAAKDAAFLPVNQRLGGEIVDTVVEAALDKAGVHLTAELLSCVDQLVWDKERDGRTCINSFICFLSMREASSRCSEALSLKNQISTRRHCSRDETRSGLTRPL
jgi:hypothetical protein